MNPGGFAERRSIGPTLALVVGVIVFTAVLFGLVLVNSVLGVRAKAASTDINVVARQSVLVQRVAADLLHLQRAAHLGRRAGTTNADLTRNVALYETAGRALETGGLTQDPTGADLAVDPLPSGSGRTLLAADAPFWRDLRDAVAAYEDRPGPRTIDAAVGTALVVAPKLADSLDGLAFAIGRRSDAEIKGLTNARNLLIGFTVLAFLGIVASLIGRVRESQRQLGLYANDLEQRNAEFEESSQRLAEAKAGTDLIMDTTSQGLFLLNPSYRIQGQYSRELESIFRMSGLAEMNLLNILQRLLTERMFLTTKDYLALLFDTAKKERTVLKVNPLVEIEINFPNPEGGYTSRFLNFAFRRIVEAGAITRVFVAVSDITERVQLEHELRESEARKERQFEFLLGILHVDPPQLDEFIAMAKEQIVVMNDVLRAQDFAMTGVGQMDALRQRLTAVFRSVHNIKGNATMLRLTYFQAACERFEAKIVELRDRVALGGDDFLTIVIAQSELRKDLDELQELRERFFGVGRFQAAGGAAGTALASGGEAANEHLLTGIATLASDLAARSGKLVRVEAASFETSDLGDEQRAIVRDVLIQLTRNSVVHGVELPSVRRGRGKPEPATIAMRRLTETPGTFRVAFRDDGGGLDVERIRRTAIARGLVGDEEAAAMSRGQLCGLIFSPGFSTATNSDGDAGRGIGMSLVKELVVDRCRGEIRMNSEPGAFTEFVFAFPLAARVVAPAPAFTHA